jgi:hypothetical protein
VLSAEEALFGLAPATVVVVLFGVLLTIACSLGVVASGAPSMRDVLRAMSVDPATSSGILMSLLLILLACWVLAARYGNWRRTAGSCLIVAFAAAVVGTLWHFSASLGKGDTLAEAFRGIGWHPLTPFVLLLVFSLVTAIGIGMASARAKFSRWRRNYQKAAKELESEAVSPLINARTYSAVHFAVGWLRALDARIGALEKELSITGTAQNVHTEIRGWADQDEIQLTLSKADSERAAQTVQDLVRAPRSTWVLLAARKFPDSTEHELDVERTGLPDSITIKNSIFIDNEDSEAPCLSFHIPKD